MSYYQFPYYLSIYNWMALTNQYSNGNNNANFQNFQKEIIPTPPAPGAFTAVKIQENHIIERVELSQKYIQKPRITQKKRRQTQKKGQDDNYRPNYQRKIKKQTVSQNQNRNIIPNSMNQILSFIIKQSKSRSLVQRIFDHYFHQESWTAKRFYLYVKKCKQKLHHYVSEDTLKIFLEIQEPLCQVYSLEEQRFYIKICRIMINHFLREQSNIIILTSKRMHNTKRREHLNVRRYLQEKIKTLLENQ